jgi:hypothetical protein
MSHKDMFMKTIMLHDFDVIAYKKLNHDLQHMTDKEAINHYKMHGIYEGRRYKNVIPNDFDVIAYKKLNNDLQHMTDKEAINHYKMHGIYEGRRYKNVFPNDFDVTEYKNLNHDLEDMTDEEAINHYKIHGFYEGRRYKNLNKIIHITHNYGGGTKIYLNNMISIFSHNYENIIIKSIDENNVMYNDNLMTINTLPEFNNINDTIVVHSLLYYNTLENQHKINYNMIDFIKKINIKKILIVHDYFIILPNIPNPIKKNNVIPSENNISEGISILSLFDKIFFNSKNCFDNYSKYINFDNLNYMILNNVPDINYYNKRIFPTKKKHYNIGLIGVINCEHKGRDLMDNILTLFNNNVNDYTFHIFGEYEKNYDNLVIHGTYDNNNIFNLIKNNNIDYFLFLSTFEETYSLTLSIAIHTGLPIIYNNIGAYIERLENYDNCFGFDENNYSVIIEILNNIHNNDTIIKSDYNKYDSYPSIYNNLPEFSDFFKTSTNELNFNLDNYVFINKAVCFIHVCNLNDCKGYEIFLDQYNYIKQSGLYDKLDYIFVTMLGNYKKLPCDYKVKLIYYSENSNEWEFQHKKRIKYFSDNINDNIKILQIHTKGVLNKPHSYEWRKYLEYFLIEQHQLCIDNLNNFKCVGVNQQYYINNENKYRNHYSGNFWWSTSEHIKRLPQINISDDRYSIEHWLIGNLEKIDYRYLLSLHHTDINFYDTHLKPSQYNMDIIKYNICNEIKTNYIKKRNIYGVYFICCIGDYIDIINSQIQKIVSSGLYDNSDKIFCFVCNVTDHCLKILSKYDKIEVISTRDNLYEKFAINNFKKYISGDYYLYYIHSKSVTRNEECYNDWRDLCDYFTIDKWRLSIELLQYYDCVGTNLKNFPKKHYSGNFWWSKSEHLNKLNNINDGYLSSEMYIFSYMKTNYVSIYQSHVNHGDTNYSCNLYCNKSDNDLINNICIIPDFNPGDKKCISMCGEIDVSNEPPILELV